MSDSMLPQDHLTNGWLPLKSIVIPSSPMVAPLKSNTIPFKPMVVFSTLQSIASVTLEIKAKVHNFERPPLTISFL